MTVYYDDGSGDIKPVSDSYQAVKDAGRFDSVAFDAYQDPKTGQIKYADQWPPGTRGLKQVTVYINPVSQVAQSRLPNVYATAVAAQQNGTFATAVGPATAAQQAAQNGTATPPTAGQSAPAGQTQPATTAQAVTTQGTATQNAAGAQFGRTQAVTNQTFGDTFPAFDVGTIIATVPSRSPDLPGATHPLGAIRTSTDLVNDLYTMNPTDLADLQQRLQAAGYLQAYTPGSVNEDTRAQYENLLKDVARYQQQGTEMTPDMLLRQRAQQIAAGGAGATSTKTTTDVSNPLTAQAVISKAFADHGLGRPNAKQLSAFTAALQAAQAQNPTVTTDYAAKTGGKPGSGSVKTATAGSTVTQNETVQQGINSSAAFSQDPQQFANNYFENTYGAQANTVGIATGFYDAALKAIGAGGQ